MRLRFTCLLITTFLLTFPNTLDAAVFAPFRPLIGWDASTDAGGDNEWNPHIDPFSGGHFWNVADSDEPTQTTFAADPDTQGITAAYDFADGAIHTTESTLENTDPESIKVGPSAANPTENNASVELWFKPDDLSGGRQVLWSFGGATDGASVTLEDSILRFQYRDTNSPGTAGSGGGDLIASVKTDITSIGTSDFIQVVGAIDIVNEQARLFVNGAAATPVNDAETGLFLSNTTTNARDDNGFTQDSGQGTNPLSTAATGGGAPGDWSGGGTARLGRNTGDVGGTAKTASDPVDLQDFDNTFQGQIGIVNLYRDALTAHQVQSNFNAVANNQSRTVDYHVTSSNATLLTDYDAANGNGTTAWEDMAVVASSDVFDLTPDGSGTSFSHNDTAPANSTYPGIKGSYAFAGGGGDFFVSETYNSFDFGDFNNPTNSSATFEVWFRPSDLTGDEVLFEVGASGDGVSIVLDGDLIKLQAKDGDQNSTAQFDLSDIRDGGTIATDEFLQVVGIVDLDGNQTEIWVDGIQRDVGGLDGTGVFEKWAGGSGVGVGGNNGVNFGSPGTLDGEISLVRVYSGILTKEQIEGNFEAVSGQPVPEPTTLVLAVLGVLGLVVFARRRR